MPRGIAQPGARAAPASASGTTEEPGRPAGGPRREADLVRVGVAGALLVFLTLAAVWALNVPTYKPPDEASHVGYARELSHGRLPTIDSLIPSDGDPRLGRVLEPRDARHRTIWTANHPPLFYALAAVPLRAGIDSGHARMGFLGARLLSAGLAALGLALVTYVALLLAPGRPQLAVAAAGLVALLPSFISISARVYNDSLAFLTATAALAAAAVFVVCGPSATRLAAVAVTAGLAALTRASGLLVVGGTALALAGRFYWRNRSLYGDITASTALLERFGRSPKGHHPRAAHRPWPVAGPAAAALGRHQPGAQERWRPVPAAVAAGAGAAGRAGPSRRALAGRSGPERPAARPGTDRRVRPRDPPARVAPAHDGRVRERRR